MADEQVKRRTEVATIGNLSEFTTLLARHHKFMPSRVAVPVLAGVKFSVRGGLLHLTTTDFEVTVNSLLSVDSDTDFEGLVSLRTLVDTLKKFDGKAPVELSVDDRYAHIVQGRNKARMMLLPLDEYPTMPEHTFPTRFELPAATLTEIVKSVVPAAGRDATLPVLTGLQLTYLSGAITVAGTDRYRFAVLERDVNGVGEPATALVRARDWKDLASVFRRMDVLVRMVTEERQGPRETTYSVDFVQVEADGTAIIFSGMEGRLPKYASLFPKEFSAVYEVSRPDALRALGIAGSACLRNQPVKLVLTNRTLTFEGGVDDDAVVSSEIDVVEAHGDNITIHFNPVFLDDGLKALGTDRVLLQVTTPSKPALLSSPDVPGFRWLLMPVRIQS